MTKQIRVSLVVFCVITLFSIPTFAQTPERRQTNSTLQAQAQSPNLAPSTNSIDAVVNEIGLLRKSLQTLNLRLGEISEKVLAADSSRSGAPSDKQGRIVNIFDLLIRAEQRAEALRKELLERIDKEAQLKSRLVQNDEDMRPESVERALNPYGTTRTAELRETRRRVLENDRRGFESLLNQITQSRVKLEEDVKQADSLVGKLRQRILPLVEKEIEKLNPNPN
jgi:hypothetical protein